MSKLARVFKPLDKGSDQVVSDDRPLLASVLEDFDPQSRSRLYCRLPKETRDAIFRFAMTEFINAPSSKRLSYHATGSTAFRPNTGYARPGYTEVTRVCFDLLLTCRRVYLETYHLPIQVKEHVFIDPVPPGLRSPISIEKYIQRFKPQQLEFLTEIHIFAHQMLKTEVLRPCVSKCYETNSEAEDHDEVLRLVGVGEEFANGNESIGKVFGAC